LSAVVGNIRTINAAIDCHSYVSFEVSESNQLNWEIESGREIFRTQGSLVDLTKVPSLLKFPVHLCYEFFQSGEIESPKTIKIKINSEIPMGSGLGGSSVLAVAMVRGLWESASVKLSNHWEWKLLNWVKDAEARFLRTATGTQDYLAALFGDLHCYHSKLGEITKEDYNPKISSELSERMVVLFSGETHHSGMSNWEIFKKALDKDLDIISGFKKIINLGEEINNELSGRTSWKKVGELISEEWNIRKDTFKVGTPKLDQIVDFLFKQTGVLGVKVCGAAQGGSLLVLAEPQNVSNLVKACETEKIHIVTKKLSHEGVVLMDGSR
jgi:D-glycero-alpha-D-manno-heptose-7-phosphate kinase